MDANSFQIRKSQIQAVQDRLNVINQKAERLGLDGLSLSVRREYTEYLEIQEGTSWKGFWSEDRPAARDGWFVRTRQMLEIVVTGETVIIDGWRFVAHIEHTEEGNIIRRMADDDLVIDNQWRTASADCAHCGYKRARKFTYLLQHEDSGEITQVGSTCVQDFLGGHDPTLAVWSATARRELGSFLAEGEEGYGSSDYTDPMEYLCWVNKSIRQSGWMPRSRAEYGRATADMAMFEMYDRYQGKDFPTAEDSEKARKVWEWATTELVNTPVDQRNEYIHNLTVVMNKGWMTHRDAGLVASAPSAYDREMSRRVQSASAQSDWVGEPKQRLKNISATLTRTCSTEGYYDPRVLNQFQDESGNVLVWWTNKVAANTGDKVSLTGTVKEHKTYQGIKQTTLTRCKVVPA